MDVAITGASGFVGAALCRALEARGDSIVRLVRREPAPGESAVSWDPAAGRLDPADIAHCGAVVHLAGEPVAQRWTAQAKARIHDSRVDGTRLIAGALARLAGPRVLVSASATGYYGDRPDETLTEASPAGTGFLADVCRDWEAATSAASAAEVRVVMLRTALVVGPGGALAQMLSIFRLGLGGPIGSGHQIWSWIDLDDHVRAILYALDRPDLAGPVNSSAPMPVSNREFTHALARVLGRPAVFPVPRFAARLVLGEFADSLFWSARVLPGKLQAAGFAFWRAELESALRHHFWNPKTPHPRST